MRTCVGTIIGYTENFSVRHTKCIMQQHGPKALRLAMDEACTQAVCDGGGGEMEVAVEARDDMQVEVEVWWRWR